MEHLVILNEINEQEALFFINLSGKDERLYIDVCGAKSKHVKLPKNRKPTRQELGKMLVAGFTLVPDRSVRFQICFDTYAAYTARFEKYAVLDEESEYAFGPNLRVYEDSAFLDFIKQTTAVEKLCYYTNHYEIVCRGQVIDVASDSEPIITMTTYEK